MSKNFFSRAPSKYIILVVEEKSPYSQEFTQQFLRKQNNQNANLVSY